MSKLTREDAIRIEEEHGLEPGDIASDREMSEAERIYLSVPTTPLLSMHVELFRDKFTLVIFDVKRLLDLKASVQGPTFSPVKEAVQAIKENWGALVMARDQGQVPHVWENVALTLTAEDENTKQWWSCSVVPKMVRNIFQGAPNPLQLRSRLGFLPPEYEGGRSPGKFIESLGVDQVLNVQSILLQRVSSLDYCDPKGLMYFTKKPDPSQ